MSHMNPCFLHLALVLLLVGCAATPEDTRENEEPVSPTPPTPTKTTTTEKAAPTEQASPLVDLLASRRLLALPISHALVGTYMHHFNYVGTGIRIVHNGTVLTSESVTRTYAADGFVTDKVTYAYEDGSQVSHQSVAAYDIDVARQRIIVALPGFFSDVVDLTSSTFCTTAEELVVNTHSNVMIRTHGSGWAGTFESVVMRHQLHAHVLAEDSMGHTELLLTSDAQGDGKVERITWLQFEPQLGGMLSRFEQSEAGETILGFAPENLYGTHQWVTASAEKSFRQFSEACWYNGNSWQKQ